MLNCLLPGRNIAYHCSKDSSTYPIFITMQNTESSLTSFSDRLQELGEHHWLDLAEYGSIGFSAIGSVVAGLSGQVLFAATPITLALSLNVLNRHRVELQTRVQNTATIAEMNQVVDSLQMTVQSLPPGDRFEDLEGTVTRISETVANIEQFLERTSPQTGPMDMMTIQKEFAVLRRAIMRLRDHTEMNLGNVQQHLNTDLQVLRQAIANYKPPKTETIPTLEIQTEITKLNQGFTDLQTQVENISNIPATPTIDIEPLQQQIMQIKQQVDQLQQQNQEIVKPYLKRLTRAVKHLNQQSPHVEKS
jgi:DNA repair exonuclease SbcCD ATPase subunit